MTRLDAIRIDSMEWWDTGRCDDLLGDEPVDEALRALRRHADEPPLLQARARASSGTQEHGVGSPEDSGAGSLASPVDVGGEGEASPRSRRRLARWQVLDIVVVGEKEVEKEPSSPSSPPALSRRGATSVSVNAERRL